MTLKDKRKVIRSILEGIVIFVLLIIMILALFTFKNYKPYDSKNLKIVSGQDKGFIAISYFGVAREGTPTLIQEKRLDEQLRSLYNNGYVTITQKDVEEYYKAGKALPDKALFLMFEDGRKDTAIFAQKILEKYNYKASMMSYAENFLNNDHKFMNGKELEKIRKSTFWELGTNGYRLSYINVFDRYKRYLGELNNNSYSKVVGYLGRDYNHYLMDYIRDKDDIPKETSEEMKKRIISDYTNMEKVYKKQVGSLPSTYVLMHSNTGAYGENDNVSEVNEQWIKKLFTMTFNREGFSFNNKENSVYDLTRMQPQAYWYANHLLMRIKDDTGSKIEFQYGDEDKKSSWKDIKGVSEFKEEKIIVTSEAEGTGLVKLKNKIIEKNIDMDVKLTGNKLGSQSIYIGAEEDLSDYIKIQLLNNYIYVYECSDNITKCIFQKNLDIFDGIKYDTIEEDMKNTYSGELKVGLQENNSTEEVKNNVGKSLQLQKEENNTVETKKSELYIPEIKLNEIGNRNMKVSFKEGKISITIDDKTLVEELKVNKDARGYVYLESACALNGYSQRNITDDIYDGVFEKLVIKNNSLEVIYSNCYNGLQKVISNINYFFNNLLNWFIENL